VPPHLPLPFAQHLHPGAVHDEVQRLAPGDGRGWPPSGPAAGVRECCNAAPASRASPFGVGFPPSLAPLAAADGRAPSASVRTGSPCR
jgi:hypothetical protein